MYLGRETSISVLENAEELDRTAKRKLKREKYLEGVREKKQKERRERKESSKAKVEEEEEEEE